MTNMKAAIGNNAGGARFMNDTTEYNTKIVAEFRANKGHVGGQWNDVPLLLLHHRGAKTGVCRVNPVAYLPDGSRFFVWAANGGGPEHPAWFHNLKTHPATRIEVGGDTFDVVAEEAIGDNRDQLFEKAALRYPQLAEAANRTDRIIPILVLRPAQIT
jgi:deazaflavin-dependent oxidoreductase (nitroreductase family)